MASRRQPTHPSQLSISHTTAVASPHAVVPLCFGLFGEAVEGMLYGTPADWKFCSDSLSFRCRVPDGCLHKYMWWDARVPRDIHGIYDALLEAAERAGVALWEVDWVE